jgi:membrane protein required for colicin V production
MTVGDFILLAMLAIFVIRGMFRGFLLELFDLVSLVIGYVAARMLGPSVGWWMADTLGIDRVWTGLLATVIVFFGVTIGVRMLAHMLKHVVHATPLAGLDRGLGALFGALKMILLSLALMFIALMSPWSEQVVEDALEGRITSVFVSWTMFIQEMVEEERTPSTQLFASWLRSAGVNDEAVHIVSDEPGLFNEIIEYARDHELNVPVRDILSGGAAIKVPDGFELDNDTQRKIVECLEDAGSTVEEKAEEFWRLLTDKADETI